jgi:hypothetical protein
VAQGQDFHARGGMGESMRELLAVDPGVNGGIAWTEDDQILCSSMPEGMTGQADFIRQIVVHRRERCAVIEKVGAYMPGNSGPAAATFARHCGHLEAILYCFGVSTEQVTPNKWMSGIGTWPKDKHERKKAIQEEMARRYPHLKVTLKVSDALGILTYALKRQPAG